MRLHAVALLIPDYNEALAFFVESLGVILLSNEDQGGGKRWVVVSPPGGGTSLVLAQAVGTKQSRAIGQQAGGRVGYFLQVDDFRAAQAQLVAAGAVFEEEPRREAYGTVAVWRDPWGNRWDLLGPP